MNVKHEKTTGNDVWLTPKHIITSLGEFDLDPCAPAVQPWPTAKHTFTKEDDGLNQDWWGRVWLNPPYGKAMAMWLERMSDHLNGIALIFARTDTDNFHEHIFGKGLSMFFIKRRLKFCNVQGIPAQNAGAPSVLIGYSPYDCDMIEQSGLEGFHVSLRRLCYISIFEGTWRELVEQAVTYLNGEASLSEIYAKCKELSPGKTSVKYYKEKIRQTLQYYFDRTEPGVYKLPEA